MTSVVPRLAVILPAYNEELTIEAVIRDFHAALPEAAIYVVDNNSSDRTGDIARHTLASAGCAGSVITELRQGKGNALRRAFMEVDAEIYVLSDADLTYPASRARDLIKPVAQGRADMVVGDRHSGGHYSEQNKRRLHEFGNELVKRMINMFFRSHLRDIMSGYRVFSRSFVKNYAILVEGFQVETDMTLHALDKRFRIIEMPVEYVDRPAGSFSKLNTFSDGAKVIFTILQILRHYKPFMFFSGLALVCLILGLVAAVPVANDWIAFRFIHHIPLAILATGLEIVAVVMFAVGLMLDSITHQERRNFELGLLREPVRPHTHEDSARE
ncbi:glycosyltransferase family 2 protein [soil metagenome]